MKKKQFSTTSGKESFRKKHILLMKLSISIYLLGCMQLLATSTFSQKKVFLKVTKQPLFTILQEIEKQTDYSFIYNNDEINENIILSVNVNDQTVIKTLDKLFRGTSIKYLVLKKQIILSRNDFDENINKKQFQQDSYTISGIVKETLSGETLIGATLIIKGTSKGVSTNEYGFYSLTLAQGSHILQISYVGFITREIKIDLNNDKKINISLEQDSNILDQVLITAGDKSKSQVKSIIGGRIHMKGEDIKKLPSLLGEPDVIRAILTQSGVSTIGEGATGFNVRGGNIDQNLILLDEAPVYNSSHLWGFFSIFNSDAIKDLKLYKGGIPARFGGRASSVLDIRQKEGSDKKIKGEGGLGLLFSRLTIEGPIKKEKLSFLVSGRRSYFDLFFPLIGDEDIENTKAYFYDLNTKLTWRINDNNKIFASGYFGADVMQLKFEGIDTEDGSKSEDEEIDFNWKNATATIRWNHLFSNKLFMNISGIYSNYNYGLSSKNDSGGGPAKTSGTFFWTSVVENWIFKPDFTFYKNADTKIRFGINNTLYRFTPAKIISGETGINNIDFDTENSLEIAPYVEYEKKWRKFSVNAGLRYSWFGSLGPYTLSNYNSELPMTTSTITGEQTYKQGEIIKSYSNFEPRLAIKYNLSNRKAIKIGYNRAFQYVQLISNTAAALPFDIWKPSGRYIKPLEVNQISGGYAYDTPGNAYNIIIEGYYKTFKNIIEYKNGADLFINKNLETQLLPANGYSYGAELSVFKTKGKLTGNLNYTYSSTKRKTASSFPIENISNGDYYPSNYDRPHVFNITANYKLGKKWELGTFFTYQTGRPTTLPNGRLIINEETYLTYSDRNAFRIPNTHRMDLSFTYKPNEHPDRKWKSSWVFGVYNIYGSKNPFSVYSILQNNQVKTFQFSVIGSPIPFITYNFKF